MLAFRPALCAAALCMAALSACARPPSPQPACRITTLDTLSLRSVQGHPVVSVTVQGEPVNMLVDTGAETSVLTTAAATRLGLKPVAGQRVGVTGIDGSLQQEVVVANVALTGRGRLLAVPLIDLPTGLDMLSGVVGMDVLSEHDLELDQPGHRLAVHDAVHCGADDLPWRNERPTRVAARLPALFTPRQRVSVVIGLGPFDVSALVDTGVPESVMSLETARRAGVSAARIAAGPAFSYVGAALQPVVMRTVEFSGVRIGAETFASMPFAVPQTPLPGVNILLGNDYLAGHRLWISFARRAVYVDAPAGSGVPNPNALTPGIGAALRLH